MMGEKVTLERLDEGSIRKLLDTIVDPCSRAAGAPAGISEMGMVPDIRIEPGSGNLSDISVTLIVTHPFCMMSSVFVREIVERLEVQPGVGMVDVNFDPSTIWTPDMMEEGYARRLEEARARRRASLALKAAAQT